MPQTVVFRLPVLHRLRGIMIHIIMGLLWQCLRQLKIYGDPLGFWLWGVLTNRFSQADDTRQGHLRLAAPERIVISQLTGRSM